jgi:hypothetical protein
MGFNNAGWLASRVGGGYDIRAFGDGSSYDSAVNNIAAAIKSGFVVIDVGTRGRGIQDENGAYVGKSPAVIVDAKAAIRYLRLNEKVIPGSAERIIITGTSGGGALTTLIAASGNSPDYYPYLREIGAAGIDAKGASTIRDDVFATVSYCPITDLGNADNAYEWQYTAVRGSTSDPAYKGPSAVSPEELAVSKVLAAEYPAYLASLGLKREDGTLLTAENMKDVITAQVKREVEEAIAEGAQIPALGENFLIPPRYSTPGFNVENKWLKIENGKAVVDYDQYISFVAETLELKPVPSFSRIGVLGSTSGGENSLFGPTNLPHFQWTQWSWDNTDLKGDGTGKDDTGLAWSDYILTGEGKTLLQQIKMVNALAYLNSPADSAPYWYLRHGIRDRDTAFAIEMELYYSVLNDPTVKDVNFELAWFQGHSGNYDVPEVFEWITGILAEAGYPKTN